MVIFYILIFAGTLLISFFASFLIMYAYIAVKRRDKMKYHFTSPAETYSIRRDYTLEASNQTGIDGSNALQNYKKGF